MNTKSGKTEILYGKYRMAPSSNAPTRFDLYKTQERRHTGTTVKKAGGKVKVGDVIRESEGDIAYGMTLEQCLSYIVSDIVADKGFCLDLAEYIAEYRKEKAALLAEITRIVDIKLKNK